jgi:hypothetical protein
MSISKVVEPPRVQEIYQEDLEDANANHSTFPGLPEIPIMM